MTKKTKNKAVNLKPPKRCPNCFREGYISNIVKGQETDAWFCHYCGGLVSWIK